MSLQAEERSFEWNLEKSRGVEGVARWMTWRRLEGVVFSFCDTTSSSLSPTTLGNFCPSLFPHPPPSYAISTFVVSLLSSDSAPESSALVFRRNTINHFSRSAGMTPPLHPRLSSKRACFVNDESFRLPDECVIFQVTIIVRSHTWVCHIASWILLSHEVSSMFRYSKRALHEQKRSHIFYIVNVNK